MHSKSSHPPLVAFGFDDRLARHSVRALTSLARHSSRPVDVVILARRWKPWTVAYYRSLELEPLRISILDMSAVSFSGELRLLSHTTAATMDRLYLPLLLPSRERLVYLDTDLICLADLEPLHELALPDSGIAARPSVKEGYATLSDLVKTWAHPGDREAILAELLRDGAPTAMRTFNAGVLVMDLRKLRERSFVRTTLDLVRRFGVNDQLAINLYTRGEFAELEPSWNVFAGQDSAERPHIIHWPGPRKPWSSAAVPFREVWDSYARTYDPIRRWLGARFGRRPVNPVQRIRRRSLAVTLALIAVSAAPACRRPAEAARPIVLVDDAGDTTRLVATPRRIVSLNPVFTELVFALGAGDLLVGRTSQCDFPAEAARVPDVGLWLPPNVEAVLARAPDLVLLYQSPSTAPAIARLRALQVPAAGFRTDHLGDVSRLARLLGPALGVEPAAIRLAARYDSSLAALRRSSRRDASLPVALVAWDNPLIVLGAGSFVSEMVELAGARNLFDDVRPSSATTSLEVLAARAPRAVLVAGTGTGGFARPEWRSLAAIRERRLVLLADPALQRPSPRAPEAIAALRRALDSMLRQPQAGGRE